MSAIGGAGISTDLASSHVAVTPGVPVRVPIAVTNLSGVIDGVTAVVDGISHDWVHLAHPVISLFPDATANLELVFDIPTSCTAGDYLITVRIESTIEPERNQIQDFWLTVATIVDLDVGVVPEIVTGGKSVLLDATVHNRGNAPARVTINAVEPTREIDCEIDTQSVLVPSGQNAMIGIRPTGKRPWFGQPAERRILITAQTDGATPVERSATFHQKARIPRGVLTALMLIGIVALWAFIFWWTVRTLNEDVPAAKRVATEFNSGGEENVPLANIASTATGTVRSGTNGSGIPRVIVEALRRSTQDDNQSGVQSFRAGDEPPRLRFVPIASGATDEDGRYSLEALVPGTYKLCFSGDGYLRRCFMAGDPGPEADPLCASEVAAGGTALLVCASELTIGPYVPYQADIVLAGELGGFSGTVDVPQNGAGSVTVTAQQVVDTAPTAPSASVEVGLQQDPVEPNTERPVYVAPVDPDGRFVFAKELPTPATYLITIEGENFETQQFEQRLDAGDTPVLNKINVTSADARMSGVVRDDQSGALLGGVTVTARSGDFVARTTTPTVGTNIGGYIFTNLKTPETYVLTFERENYASRTVSRQLGPGQQLENLEEALIGGSGAITGSAVSADDGIALNGLTVTVIADGFITSSSTLSDGSFFVDGLPTSGSYAITLTGATVQPETVTRPAAAEATVDVGQVTMTPTTSKLVGTIRVNGVGRDGLTVTLSNGTRTVATTSATSPAGQYAFSQLAPSSYTITVEGPLVQTRVVLVTVGSELTTTRDITVQEDST